MINSKIPVATTITLLAFGDEEFYAVIIPEETKRGKCNNLWVFRKGCGVAYFYTSRLADNNDSTMTPDGVRALDAIGQFDEIKEMLFEEK